ncbi:MAG TPA: hypothetical protein VMU83_21905 [Hanamia sp.]|nr:hypothetical protein [Hanamia sp.]
MTYTTKFYKELESSLPTSTAQQRKIWATTILEKNINIKDLSELLKDEQKTAIRFLWMLSDVGILNPNKLFMELPFLLNLCNELNHIYKTSFASYWLYAGVPSVNEGEAIDLLFQWLLSPDTNVTIKSRSIPVLFKLTKKYPELKNELAICLKDQMDKYTNDFKKRASKILMQIEQ